MKIKDTNIFNTVGVCIWKKKTMVKSVIYLLFSYKTGYIMWHSRIRIYSKTIVFLLEAFWLDVTTSRDECTCTRLNSVVSTRKRPFTEEKWHFWTKKKVFVTSEYVGNYIPEHWHLSRKEYNYNWLLSRFHDWYSIF